MSCFHGFSVGDRVECTKDIQSDDCWLHRGSLGTIELIDKKISLPFGVVWDDDIGGHNFFGRAKPGHGWWVSSTMITHYIPDFEQVSEVKLKQFLGIR